MLLDLYGALLTDRQRRCFSMYVNEDLSLTEIAEEMAISRQGVWDSLRRTDTALRRLEEKLGLLRRSEELRDRLGAVEGRLRLLLDENDSPALRQALGELEQISHGI